MSIDWKFSADNGANWVSAGHSTNTMYVTLADPATNAVLYHTVVDIGCRNAKGYSSESNVIEGIWSDFMDLNVRNVRGATMCYYSNTVLENTPFTITGLLTTADGECSTWASMFQYAIRVHGVTNSSMKVCYPAVIYLWNSNLESNDVVTNIMFRLSEGGFLVKNWSLLNPSWKTNDLNHNCVIDTIDSEFPDFHRYIDPGKSNVIIEAGLFGPFGDTLTTDGSSGVSNIVPTGIGVNGQGNILPSRQLFQLHYVVTRENPYVIYDPSYGKVFRGTNAVSEWTASSVDGYYQQWAEITNTIVAMPNDTNCVLRTILILDTQLLEGLSY